MRKAGREGGGRKRGEKERMKDTYWSSKLRLGGLKTRGSEATTGEGSPPSIGSPL